MNFHEKNVQLFSNKIFQSAPDNHSEKLHKHSIQEK